MGGAVRLAVLERLPVAVHLTLEEESKAPQREQKEEEGSGVVLRTRLTSLGLPPGFRAKL